MQDLIRVLRIKRLASLGIPLDQMPGLLAAENTADDLLSGLDAELAAQIDRLTEQRNLIARLRDHDAPPDFPPALAPFRALLDAAGRTPDVAELDRDQAMLLAHFAGEDGMPHVTQLYERLTDPALISAVTATSERFSKISAASTEQKIDEFIESFLTTFSPVVMHFATSESPIGFAQAEHVFAQFAIDLLNETQRRTLTEIERRLGGTFTVQD